MQQKHLAMKAHSPLLMSVAALISLLLGPVSLVKGQSTILVHADGGTSTVNTSGSALYDLADPYLKPVFQYAFGVDYERALSNHFSVLTGAQFASRGFAAREHFNIDVLGIDLPVGASVETKLNYIEVPLAMKYYFTDHGVMPYVKAGGSVGYAVAGKITPTVDAIVPWRLPSIPLNLENDLYNRVDLALQAGAGVSIPVNSASALQFEINYRHGLSDMLHEPVLNLDIRSSGFTAGIGFTVNF
jgi:opacity protein-like surface antigen